MFKILQISILIFLLESAFAQKPQHYCGTMELHEAHLQADPQLQGRMMDIERHTEQFVANYGTQSRTVVTIPVVIHVIWRTTRPTENISDAQVNSQIEVMNEDFRRLNAEWAANPSANFRNLSADTEIQFCLAQRDPQGRATNGIMRYESARTSTWGVNDDMKKAASGGVTPWDPSKYLNIWVCAIGGGILGYGQFPGGSPLTDGVVIDYRYFGTNGTATNPFNLGRTATHEIGHWLNLRHIWGDAACGNDLVDDTPTQGDASLGCPFFPKYSCNASTGDGDMFMNFMDYSDDACMYMFTSGQKARMQATFFGSGAPRASLLTSNGCQPPSVAASPSCGIPTNFVVTPSETSASAAWSALTGATNYVVEYRQLGTTTWLSVSSTTTSATIINLTAGQVYETRLRAVCSGTEGGYITANFQTVVANCSRDVFEPNESIYSAKTTTSGATVKAQMSTNIDRDFFTFTTSTAEPKVRVTMTDLPGDYDMRLYDGNGRLLAVSINVDNQDEQIVYNSGRPGAKYFIRINAYANPSATQCYTLRVETSAENMSRNRSARYKQDVLLEEMRLSPNPASEILTIEIQTDADAMATAKLTDLTGKTVLTEEKRLSKSASAMELDVTSLPEGMYILSVIQAGNILSEKVYISRK